MNTVTRDYIDGFFKLKSLEEWGNPETGGILETDDTIAALNLVPAKFGHILFFSKNQKAHDLVEKDKNGAYVLSEQERTDFIKASHQAMQEIHDILQEDPERILQVYKKWIKDDKLMSKIP
jgi:diadenosine tetraphosphate (Ap4A) HIT family hydrolase